MRRKITILGSVLLAPMSAPGCYYRPMDGGMGIGGHMMGYEGYGGMFMWILFIVIAIGIVFFVLDRSKKADSAPGATSDSPMDVLKKRYARGEIDQEEFERMKKELET